MSPEPLTAERTYQKLKQDIVYGEYRPGATLHLQRIAEEFGSSVSPVRDAVHRMVGERLVELHPGGGFQLPTLSAGALRDLYRWNDHLIRQAIRGPLPETGLAHMLEPQPGEDEARCFARCISTVFSLVAAMSDSAEPAHAIANATDRLYIARLREPIFLKAMADELQSILSVTRSGPASAMRAAVREYHRRRLRRVARIATALMHR